MSTSRGLPPLAAVLLVLSAAPAQAQTPACDGNDAAAAATHAENGERLLREASGRGSAADRRTAGEAALREFDAQCAAGDDAALLGRALAFLALGQRMESAVSLDAYLARHDVAALDATTQRRVNGNLAAGSVTVAIEGAPAGAHLFIDGFDFGELPRERAAHLPYGEHAIEARRGSSIVAHDRATLDSTNAAATVTLALGGDATPPPPPHVDAPPPPHNYVPPEPHRTDFLPWYIVTGSVAAVGVGTGIAFLLAMDERARTYNARCVPTPFDPAGCSSVLKEHDTFATIAAISLVTGGVALAALAVVGILDLSQPHHHTRIACAPTFGGLSCAGEF